MNRFRYNIALEVIVRILSVVSVNMVAFFLCLRILLSVDRNNFRGEKLITDKDKRWIYRVKGQFKSHLISS